MNADQPTTGEDRGTGRDTAGSDYAARLERLQSTGWKRVLDVQRPYRWNLRRLHPGRTLDVGCGIGRNLSHLSPESVGVDHNASSVAVCTRAGLTAYTTQQVADQPDLLPEGAFDSLLLAHLLEHVDEGVADDILAQYLPRLRRGGKVVLITPQEVGFRSDETHIRFVDFAVASAHARRAGLVVDRTYSFPFPRPAGKVFAYNEFVTVAHLPS